MLWRVSNYVNSSFLELCVQNKLISLPPGVVSHPEHGSECIIATGQEVISKLGKQSGDSVRSD